MMQPTATGSCLEPVQRNLHLELSDIFSSSQTEGRNSEGCGHILVYMRMKPSDNRQSECSQCVHVEGAGSVILQRAKDKNFQGPRTSQRFTFNRVYGPDTTQKCLFDGTVKPLVGNFLDGQNCLVFTYGVTNSGKTYTVQGVPGNYGLLPRSLSVIFNSLHGLIDDYPKWRPYMSCGAIFLSLQQAKHEEATKAAIFAAATSKKGCSGGEDFITASGASGSQDGSSTQAEGSSNQVDDRTIFVDGDRFDVKPEHGRYLLWVSYYEVYNEVIYDLLCQPTAACVNHANTPQLARDPDATSFVKDLTWVHVKSIQEAFAVLNAGRRNQRIASTELNKHSSRSHSIFSIRLIQRTDSKRPVVKQVNEFSVCDLAGSERSSKTHNTGDRLQEACKINRSLLSLGKCILIQRQNQQRSQKRPVPYRESKLSQIFQSFLSGRGHACMVVNMNPSANMFDENLHVLKFSALAKQVVTCTLKPPRPSRKRSSIAGGPEPKRKKSIALDSPNLSNVSEEEEHKENEEDDEDDDDSSVEDTFDRIKQLNMQYEEEKRRVGEEVEATVREQVEDKVRLDTSKKWSTIIHNMSNKYTNMLQKMEEMYELRIEQRTDILSSSWKNYYEEYKESTSLQLEEEKLKVQERDEYIAQLEQQLQSLPNDLEDIWAIGQMVLHDLEEPNGQTTDVEREPLNSPPMDLVPQEAEAATVQLTGMNRPCRANLAAQAEVVELREMLKKNGEAFIQKNAELSALQESLKDKNDVLAQVQAQMAYLQDELAKTKKTKDDVADPARREPGIAQSPAGRVTPRKTPFQRLQENWPNIPGTPQRVLKSQVGKKGRRKDNI